MAECPFCKATVADSLIRDGGRCPRCFIEIPGEETPTNPGIDLPAEATTRPASQRRLASVAGVVAILLIAGALAAWKLQMDRLAQARAVAEALPVFYLEPLGEVVPSEPQDTVSGAARTPSRLSGSRSSDEGAAVASASNDRLNPTRFAFTDGEADARFTGLAEPAGPRDLDLGIPQDPDGPVRLRRQGATSHVLVDPAEIHLAVGTAIQAYRGQVTNCYDQRLKSAPNVNGSWSLKFTILPDGATSDVHFVPLGTGDAELETCVVRRASTWKFQPMIQAQQFELPFRFGSGA